jgi:hypothetical protein
MCNLVPGVIAPTWQAFFPGHSASKCHLVLGSSCTTALSPPAGESSRAMNDRPDRHYGTILVIVLLSAAATGFAFVPIECVQNLDHTPNPEARAIYERRGAPFEPVQATPAAAASRGTTRPDVPIFLKRPIASRLPRMAP